MFTQLLGVARVLPSSPDGAGADGDTAIPGIVGKPLALLTFLHATGGAATREQLVDLLWADVPPESGRHTLRQTLWYLRKRLGGQPFATEGDIVKLTAPIASDRADFLAAHDGGDSDTAFHTYTGDFLPGFASPGAAAFEQWADLERQRLRALFIGAAGRVVRTRLEAGRARDALAAARRARVLAPASQATWRMVLESLMAAGDLVGAKAEAERLTAELAADDLEPEPATQQLLRVVQLGRPRPAADAEPRALDAELVGRDAPFAALLHAYERAAGSTPQHVHVSGPAGLGKTRLLDGLAARLRSQRGLKARLVTVRATPAERSLPFAFAGQLVSALVGLRGAAAVSPDARGTLVALAPAASTFLDAPPDRSTGDEALRRRALAVTELVAAVSDDAPLALLIDDVHWMDAASRTLVAAMSERLMGARVLVVTTGRGADAFAELVPRAQLLPLAPLSVDDVTALVTSVAALPVEPWAELFPVRLATATGGSPLLIMETLQLALERGQLALAEDTWQCAAPAELLQLLGAGHALQQRVAALPATARDVLLALALAGDALNEDTVRRVVGVEVREALTLLDTRGLAMRAGDRWRPAHDEIAAMAADLASPRDRTQTHAALADWLEAQPLGTRGRTVARALFHRWRAGDTPGAQRAARRLVDQLRSEGDETAPSVLLREALGAEVPEDEVQRLAATLPAARQRLWSRLPWLVAAASLVGAALLARRPAPAPEPPDPDVSLVTQVSDSAGGWHWARMEVALDALVEMPAIDLAVSTPLFPDAALDSVNGIRAIPSHGEFVGDRLRTDRSDLAIDLVRLSAAGTITPLVSRPRDQGIPTPNPDGSAIAFVDRAHWPTQAADLALHDVATGQERRLTATPWEEKMLAWSPDGRHLAFVREYPDSTPAQLCRMDVASQLERCEALPRDYVPMAIRAWRADDRLLLETISRRSGLLALVLLSADGRQAELIDEGAQAYWTDPLGQLLLCECRTTGVDRPAVMAFTVEQPQRKRPLHLNGRRVPQLRASLLIWRSRPPTPSTIRINAPDTAMVGERVRLAASARDARGRDIVLPTRRWEVLDVSRATVDSVGVLQLTDTGTVRVVLRAGDARTDTASIRVVPTNARTVLAEDFAAPLSSRWFVLGSPSPTIARGTLGPVLRLNGDERLTSNVVSRATVDARRGAGVRVRFRLPISRPVWQSLRVSIEATAPDSLLQQLEQRPDDPIPGAWDWRVHRGCEVMMPRGEGGGLRDLLGLSAGRIATATRRAPPRFGDGRTHEVEIQVFADGRCSFALDGEEMGISENAILLDRPLRVHLDGQSVGALIEIERVEFWQGVRSVHVGDDGRLPPAAPAR